MTKSTSAAVVTAAATQSSSCSGSAASSEAILQDLFKAIHQRPEIAAKLASNSTRRKAATHSDSESSISSDSDNSSSSSSGVKSRKKRKKKEKKKRKKKKKKSKKSSKEDAHNSHSSSSQVKSAAAIANQDDWVFEGGVWKKKAGNSSKMAKTKKQDDIFWDSKWEAKQLQKSVEKKEEVGRLFLEDQLSKKSRKRDRERERSESPECSELKRLRELKNMEELNLTEEQKKVKLKPVDPKKLEFDERTRMWKRKDKKSEKDKTKEKDDHRSDPESRNKKEKKDTDREEGEVLSEDEDEQQHHPKERHYWKPSPNRHRSPERRERSRIHSHEDGRSRRKSRSPEYRDRYRDRTSREETHKRSRSRSASHTGFGNNKRHHSRSCSRSRQFGSSRHHSRSRSHSRSLQFGSSRRRSRSRSRNRYGSRRRSRSHSRRRHMSRSRSRSRDRGYRGSRAAVDKEKLLAIARKNAVKLLSSNNLQGINEDKLRAIKSGGQSLAQLTSFCQELAKKGLVNDLSDDDLDLINQHAPDSSDGEGRFHHPFRVEDRALPTPFQSGTSLAGSSLAPAGLTLEHTTPTMKAAAKSQRMLEFPVSSGNAHREKEGEEPPPKPEEPKKPEVVLEPPQDPLFVAHADVGGQNQVGNRMFGGPLAAIMYQAPPAESVLETKPSSATPPAPNSPAPPASTNSVNGNSTATSSPVENSATSSSKADDDKVFADVIQEPTKDISSIVNLRLSAMRKLNENPNNPEGLQEMYDAQQQMSNWALSQNKPGQFTGSTGAKVLSKAELTSGLSAWARQEQFTQAKRVQGGFGEFMLKKMGWTEGEGLGKDRKGDVDPLTLDIKMDKRGLMASEELLFKKKRGGDVATLTGCGDLSNKHPVSALIELSTKRHWGPPNFVLAFEVGPAHRKQYIFKVVVNGVEYQPTVACDNKKKAKADAATAALIELRILPKDPNNPL